MRILPKWLLALREEVPLQLSHGSLNAMFHIEMLYAMTPPKLRGVLEPIALITSLAQAVPSAAKFRSIANRLLGPRSGHTSRRSR